MTEWKKGILERRFDKKDRRQVRIVLSDKARELNDKYNQVSDAMNERFTGALLTVKSNSLKRLWREYSGILHRNKKGNNYEGNGTGRGMFFTQQIF